MQDVIDCCVAGVSALAPPTTQTVSGKVINGGPAMAALVGSTKGMPSLRPTATRVVSSSMCNPSIHLINWKEAEALLSVLLSFLSSPHLLSTISAGFVTLSFLTDEYPGFGRNISIK